LFSACFITNTEPSPQQGTIHDITHTLYPISFGPEVAVKILKQKNALQEIEKEVIVMR